LTLSVKHDLTAFSDQFLPLWKIILYISFRHWQRTVKLHPRQLASCWCWIFTCTSGLH